MNTNNTNHDPLAGMRGEENDLLNLIGAKGDGWQIIACEGQGVTPYYPAVDENGNELDLYDDLNGDFDEYLRRKTKRMRLTVRYTVYGNPIFAEEYVRETTGCLCLSTSPTTIDVYYATENTIPPYGEE